MPEHLFLTGKKRVGKSTLLQRILPAFPRPVGGVYTLRAAGVVPSVRSVHLLRAGTNERPTLNNLLFLCAPHDPAQAAARFDALGCAALEASAGAALWVMDELGPNESAAQRFCAAVLAALDGAIPILGVLQEADTPFLQQVAAHPRVRVVRVTEENRDALARDLPQKFCR